MSSAIFDSLREAYNPNARAMTIVLSGSTFVLFLFLTTPDFRNPYYVGGLVTTILAVASSIAILALERWR